MLVREQPFKVAITETCIADVPFNKQLKVFSVTNCCGKRRIKHFGVCCFWKITHVCLVTALTHHITL